MTEKGQVLEVDLEPIKSTNVQFLQDGANNLQICININNFKPEEVKVTINHETRMVSVEAKHIEDSNNGLQYISKEFLKRFSVPEGYHLDKLMHEIKNGQIFIEIPVIKNELAGSSTKPAETITEKSSETVSENAEKSVKIVEPTTSAENPVVHLKMSDFKATINVNLYDPEDIIVTTNFNTRTVSIEAKHMEKMDNSLFVARQFTRKFTVPPTYKLEDMQHEIRDGALAIHIPLDSRPFYPKKTSVQVR